MAQVTYSTAEAVSWASLIEVAYNTYEAAPHVINPEPPTLPNDDWQVIANLVIDSVIAFISKKQFFGFVAESKADPSQVGIVLRGTDGVMDWLDDFECVKVEFTDIPNGGKTEDGFTKLYNSIEVMVPGQTETQTFSQFTATLADKSLVTITGHSLGGGIANLAAVVLTTQQPELNVALYTFAAPMTGDQTFADAFNTRVANSFRIYNKPDIVPTQPSVHLGYVQVNTGIEINSLQYPSIAKNLLGYHSIKTYLYVLSQQQA